MKTTITTLSRSIGFLTIAAGLVALAGCSSTTVDETWKSPDVKQLAFKKVLIVAPIADGAVRRTVEDEVKVKVNAKDVDVIPSYTVIPSPANLKLFANIQDAIFRTDADGLVVIRPVSNRTEISSAGGAYPYPAAYGTLRGYWGVYGALPLAYAPDVYTDQIITVETNIYDARSLKLLWSGTTETTDPTSVRDFVDSVAKAIREELQKQGLVPAPKK